MKLNLIRTDFSPVSTIGNLYIDKRWFCFSLEDVYRESKILGKTAIPYGTYEIITNWSNRFKRIMPLLLNVPEFEGVRIHSGNTDEDTEGCILLGYKYSPKVPDFIGQSKLAFFDFFYQLRIGLKSGKVYITVKNKEDL